MTILGHLFGIKQQFFDSASVPGEAASEDASSQAVRQLPAANSSQARPTSAAAWRESGATCITCGIGIGCAGFESPEEQRQHFKTDWHRYNVKRRLAKQPAVSEEQFERILEQGTEVSISGSESDSSSDEGDSDDEPGGGNAADFGAGAGGQEGRRRREGGKQQQAATAIPRVTFQAADGSLFSVWRCLLLRDHVKAPQQRLDAPSPSSPAALLGELRRLRAGGGSWLVVLLRGGHFAATVFKAREGRSAAPAAAKGDPEALEGFEVVAHKTFHRYVVRAKAGGKQSSKDATGKFARSAGSRLRRYNEVALEREVQELLTSWASHIASADLIFVQAPSSNARSLFTEGQTALLPTNPRLRRVPFVTHRPTFSETKRVLRLLCTVFRPEAAEQVLARGQEQAAQEETEAAAVAAALAATRLEPPKPSGTQPTPPHTEAGAPGSTATDAATPSPPSSSAAAAASADDRTAEAAPSVASTSGTSASAPAAASEGPLHRAAKAGDPERVRRLLESGHDPNVRDAKGRTPYALAADKDTRDAFRRFMAQQPDRWDYSGSGIPSPLTEEMEAAQAAKKAAHKAKLKAKDADRKASKADDAAAAGGGSGAAGRRQTGSASAAAEAAGAARKQAVEDEIAQAVAAATAMAARLNASSKAAASSSTHRAGGAGGKVGGGGTAGGGKAGKSAGGRAAAGQASASAASAAPPSAEELARRREVMAAAAEARMRALTQASQQQKLW